MNIAKNLENAAFYFPDRTAVIEGDRKISFIEFSQESNRVASALTGLGVRPGDRVGICRPNSYNLLTIILAKTQPILFMNSISVRGPNPRIGRP